MAYPHEAPGAALPLGGTEQRVIEFFGCSGKATRWLERPKRAFNGRTPRQMIEAGNDQEVLQLLIQAEHGFVF